MPAVDNVVCILFNPQAIDCSISTDNPEATLTIPSDHQPEKEDELTDNGDENTVTEFSVEQRQRFQTRFKEGAANEGSIGADNWSFTLPARVLQSALNLLFILIIR